MRALVLRADPARFVSELVLDASYRAQPARQSRPGQALGAGATSQELTSQLMTPNVGGTRERFFERSTTMGGGRFDRIFIRGEWVTSTSDEVIPVINPATEEVIASVPAGSVEDADRAARGARAAFEAWAATPPLERGKLIQRMAEGLQDRAEVLAASISAEVGMPRHLALGIQVAGPLANFASYASLAETFDWEEPVQGATIVRAPVGVVAAITPWNFPLNQLVDKVAPALLAGCTVILKPSEVAPLTAWDVAEVAEEVGLPDGVFNLVSGTGPVVGEALVRHPDVDMISFTGSTRAGKRIATLAAEQVKRVALEMGGKSANILLEDADLDVALPASVAGCYMNSGQVCVALSRLLVPRDRYEEVVERVKGIAEQTTVGDPGGQVQLGPVVSEIQRDRVRAYIEKGIEEGARLVTGGPDAPSGLQKGYYIRPTVFADVDNSMTIAQEEIFGPVLSVIPFDDEEDAIRIANDTTYGLSGAVWSTDEAHARQVARRLRTGTVRVNGGRHAPAAPFGGFKQSGLGREKGRFGLEEFVELQTIVSPTS
jgi:aldehyde dehydrogenase (NAD+)